MVFHQNDGRNVYVMCAACADHNIRNRRGVELVCGEDLGILRAEVRTLLHNREELTRQLGEANAKVDPHLVDRRLNAAGAIGLLERCYPRIGQLDGHELRENIVECMEDFAKINGGHVIRSLMRISWEPPEL